MAKKKDVEYVIVDAVKYVKGTEPKAKEKPAEDEVVATNAGGATAIRKDVQAGDYSNTVASAKRKADHAENN